MPDNIEIYVDARSDNDDNPGTESAPVRTAGKAFTLLPPSWRGRAAIIFAPGNYTIETDAVSFGMPVGPDASPLVIRGTYNDLFTITAQAGSNEKTVVTTLEVPADELVGAVLTRRSGTGSPIGHGVSIRGNTAGPAMEISLQQTMVRVAVGDTFVIQRPAVTLKPTRTLNVMSHDARSPNLTMIGVKFEPAKGAGLNLINVRAQCDTCEFSLRKATGIDLPTIFPTLYIHTDARIIGGIEMQDLSPGLPSREQAGVFIHANDLQCLAWAVRNGILSGHLTFKGITVRVSQGGVFAPLSLEALSAPIRILAGGSGIGQLSWGTPNNKARIRNVVTFDRKHAADGDGLRVFNGGTLNCSQDAINLDIFGCNRDGIRLDMGSTATFGPPGADAGLVTTGIRNGGFGMNVRNASRALIGRDAAVNGLTGSHGDVTLDDDVSLASNWSDIRRSPLSNAGMSLVRINK
ncbi:MAG TPA: hypothetical protein VN644_14695 [Pyrinomonadaceae bacterium]|nr:hypothetical protein [Pyrinomonadaceae bacterium]